MKKWKQAVAVAAVSLAGFAPSAEAAGYTLNEAVKTATPALKQAAQIGVLKYANPALVTKANKDAIVVLSFGTTYADTRARTIDATIDAIKAAHPGVKVVTAFTSHIIIERIKADEGINYPTPEEALAKLAADGYTRVAIASLNLFPGMEYAYNVAVFNQYKDKFKALSLATPLMYWMGQENQTDEVADFVTALKTQLPKRGGSEAVLLMAHGTMHPSNAYYFVLQERLRQAGLKNVFVYTVEGSPSLKDVMATLKKEGIKKVQLQPIMMAAGDHATNDMAGTEPDSHKSVLEKAGFKVSAYVHGLGENPAIRALYVKHAKEAWLAIQE